jgi:hypothetical protein
VALRLPREVLLLGGQRLVLPLELAAAALVLVQREHGPQVGVGEPLELLAEAGPPGAQVLAAGLELLGQPRATLCAGDVRRMPQQLAQVPPDELVQLLGGDVARRAGGIAVGVGGLALPVAEGVGVPPVHGARGTGESAAAAADQGAQEVRVGGVVAPGELLEEHHLVHVVAGEPVGGGEEHAVYLPPVDRVAQAVQPRARQDGPAVPVVPEDVLRRERPAVRPGVGHEAAELLLNRLLLHLVRGRDADVHRYAHGAPPGRGAPRPPAPSDASPTAGGVGTPGPTAAVRHHRDARPAHRPLALHGSLRGATPRRERMPGPPGHAPRGRPAPGASSTGAGPTSSGRTCHLRLNH